MNRITNDMEVIDSRDIIKRIDELEGLLKEEYEYIDETDFECDTLAYEYQTLKALTEQLVDVQDWKYGATLIHEDYFTEYCKGMLEDCGSIPKDLPWYIENHIDWEGVAKGLKMDYYKVEFDGEIYYIR